MTPPSLNTPASAASSKKRPRPFEKNSSSSGNAFSMLMSGSMSSRSKTVSAKKTAQIKTPNATTTTSSNRTGIGFVACPAGCGRHLPNLDHKINQHLDQQCPKMKEDNDVSEDKTHASTGATGADPLPESPQKKVGTTTPLADASFSFPTTPAPSSSPVSTPKICANSTASKTSSPSGTSPGQADSPGLPPHNPIIEFSGLNTPANAEHVQKKSLPLSSSKSDLQQSSDNGGTSAGEIHNKRQSPKEELKDSSASCLVSPEQQTSTNDIPDKEAGDTTLSNNANTTTTAPTRDNPYSYVQKNDAPSPTSKEDVPKKKKNNAFAHMMQRSTFVFAANHTKNTTTTEAHPQQFTLEYIADRDDFGLTLTTNQQQQQQQQVETWDPPVWTTTVQVKDKSRYEDMPPRTVSLTLAATIRWSDTTTAAATAAAHNNKTVSSQYPRRRRRLVQHHSRLSVPVLKSMLQKSVRRRRPMPAVRVAMELLDKSCGELLRRLPIIMVEDSTLHSDLPLVVWMMVAHSKGLFDSSSSSSSSSLDPQNEPTKHNPKPLANHVPMLLHAMKIRLLRIVYQMASCPHQDHLLPAKDFEEYDNTSNDNHSYPSISEPFQSMDNQNPTEYNNNLQKKHGYLMIWGMLVRAEYGGMACDVSMLKRFAQLWHDRLRLLPSDNNNSKTQLKLPAEWKLSSWSQVPQHVHAKGKEQSLLRVPGDIGLDKLSLTDICKEGVDFHCSNVVDQLLKDPTIVEACRDALKHQLQELDEPAHLVKRCIWRFSAGVNLRRPLIDNSAGRQGENAPENAPLKQFWNDVLAPRVQAFQTKYLQERLR